VRWGLKEAKAIRLRRNEQKPDSRPQAVGEPAEDGETLNSQDRPVVNPAGAGRKIERLSREICHFVPKAFGTTHAAMNGDRATEVSRGHSIPIAIGRRAEQ